MDNCCYKCGENNPMFLFHTSVPSGKGYNWPSMKEGLYKPKEDNEGNIIEESKILNSERKVLENEWVYIGPRTKHTKVKKDWLYLQEEIKGGSYESSPMRCVCYSCENTSLKNELNKIYTRFNPNT